MTSTPDPNASPIVSFYDDGFEETRLDHGLAQLEAVRTRQLLARTLPPTPATVVDVGGGAGGHAFWLAAQGYTVHLVDPVARLVGAAEHRNATVEHPLASAATGDARALAFANESADAVLLLGPLYHLTTVEERASALAEARRVLRPGGVLFAAAITRWAGALYGLTHDLYTQPGFDALVRGTLHDGQNRNPAALRGGFTDAYYHRPEELAAEVHDAGFERGTLHGVEGPASLLPDFELRWRDEQQRRTMIMLAETLGTEPSLLGVSAHLMCVAFAP